MRLFRRKQQSKREARYPASLAYLRHIQAAIYRPCRPRQFTSSSRAVPVISDCEGSI